MENRSRHVNLGHGPRLSQREYEKCIVALYSELPNARDRQQKREARRRELDLTIDFRLGKEFPKERRDALWDIQQRVESKRLMLMLYWLLRFISHKWLYQKANRVARYVIDEYAKVLSREELQAYFGTEECENPSLPIE
ncbi:MAG TPA: hypothetical protein VFW53_00505 [Gallionella sp.]|nr:hypothetical protein [Gallionella sp.]